MKIKVMGFLSAFLLGCHLAGAQTNAPIPWHQIGAKAGTDYKGDGLTVTPAACGARLRCVFQRLEGEATGQGLWLTSMLTNLYSLAVGGAEGVRRGVEWTRADRFQVKAVAVARGGPLMREKTLAPSVCSLDEERVAGRPEGRELAQHGEVSVDGQSVRFTRPGLIEECSVSMDGVRQDFVVMEPSRWTPKASMARDEGALRVELAVTGARVEQTAYGAQLVLEQSGRKIGFGRLKVTDANGNKLPARMAFVAAEVTRLKSAEESRIQKEMDQSLLTSAATSASLAVVVDDAEAIYPIRIDP